MFRSIFSPVCLHVVDCRPLPLGPMSTATRRLSGVVLGSVLQTGNSLEFPPDPAVAHTSRLADEVQVFLKTSTERECENTLSYRELWFSRINELAGQELPGKLAGP